MDVEPVSVEEGFDFDHWAELARTDPAAFDLHREAFIDAHLGRYADERRDRLVRLQWRLDTERERTSNALGACIHLSKKMWDNFSRLDDLLSHVLNNRSLPANQPLAHPPEVIPFPNRQSGAPER
jgi:hypothetical protein